MNAKDSASKRSVASPKVHSLRQDMGLSDPKGYGSPDAVQPLPQNMRSHGGKSSKKGGGLKSKTGYDVKTRVSIAKSKKK